MKTMEEKILGAVWETVINGVYEALEDVDENVPAPEKNRTGFIQDYEKRRFKGTVGLVSAERTEKERIVRLDAYRVVITITASETDCYRYAYALEKAVDADVTLGGLAERVLFEKKVYNKKLNLTEAVFNLRITVEGLLC